VDEIYQSKQTHIHNIRNTMKRSHPFDDSKDHEIPTKKRRLDMVTPFCDKIDLANIFALKEHVYKCPFCICLERGVFQHQCSYCKRSVDSTKDFSDVQDALATKAMEDFKSLTMNVGTNYLAHVIIEDLVHKCKTTDLQICLVGDNEIEIRACGARHISSSFIELVVTGRLVKEVTIDLSGNKDIIIVCAKEKSSDRELVSSDKILMNHFALLKKNVLSQSRHCELLEFL
jgi:hypothetical protein